MGQKLAFIRNYIWPIVLAASVFLFNVLGAQDLATAGWYRLVDKGAAPLYVSRGQERIAVVTLDEQTILEQFRSYPIPYAQHGALLRNILCLGPAVLYINFNFRYLRGQDAGLQRMIDLLRYRKVSDGPQGCRQLSNQELATSNITEIFIAFLDPGDEDRDGFWQCFPFRRSIPDHCPDAKIIAKLQEVATPVDATNISFTGPYKLRRKSTVAIANKSAKTTLMAPALALLQSYCSTNTDQLQACRDIKSDIDAFDSELVVRWGYYISDTTRSMSGGTNCAGEPGALRRGLRERVMQGLAIVWRYFKLEGWQGRVGKRREQNCPFATEINATDILLNPKARILQEALAGKVVLYGGESVGQPGQAVSPVHGRLGGTHLHAMALDNLMTYGARYPREPKPVLGTATYLNVVEFLIVLLFLALSHFLSRLKSQSSLRINVYYSMIIAGLLIAASMVLASITLWPAVNILALTVMAFFSRPRTSTET